MTDTTAAPEDRYSVECDKLLNERYLVDRVLGKRVTLGHLSWSAAHCEAQRLNREARAALNKSAAEPAAPSCDCPAERYRHALAQIWRTSSDPNAIRYAKEALRAKGETR